MKVVTKKGATYVFSWKKGGETEFYRRQGKVVFDSGAFNPDKMPLKASLAQIDYWLKTQKNDERIKE